MNDVIKLFILFWRHKRKLLGISKVSLSQRYASTLLGVGWLFINPFLFLGVYLFVYLVIFQVRFPGFGNIDYVIYVFSGLIPYISLMEAVNSSSTSLKANLHLIKNVVLPLELIPFQCAFSAVFSQAISIGFLIVISSFNDSLNGSILLLPLILAVQFVFLFAVSLIVGVLSIGLPDVVPTLNIILLLLMFLSPIAYTTEMLPAYVDWIIFVNPVSYMLEPYRIVFSDLVPASYPLALGFILISTGALCLAAWLFGKTKRHIVDYGM